MLRPGMLTSMTDRHFHDSVDIGIVGGGQLARMTAQAAIPLGIHLRILAARPDDSAARVCPDVFVGSPDDPDFNNVHVEIAWPPGALA